MNQVADYYLKVQALTPVDGGRASSSVTSIQKTDSLWNFFTNPLPLSVMLFLLLTGIGLISLVVTKTKDINKVLTLLFMALMTSAIPFGLQVAGQKTRLESQASPTYVPKNVVVQQVTATGFVVKFETDAETVGTLRIRKEKGQSISQQVFSEPDTVKGTNHLIAVTRLLPQTDYYLEILSGSQWFNLNGEPIRVKTAVE